LYGDFRDINLKLNLLFKPSFCWAINKQCLIYDRYVLAPLLQQYSITSTIETSNPRAKKNIATLTKCICLSSFLVFSEKDELKQRKRGVERNSIIIQKRNN
jgi:hypothetical protein